jgi:chromosome segregation ATPase
MSNKDIAFRTSVNGYNKKDVYNYLDGVNKDIKNRSDEYERKISTIESDNKILQDKYDSLNIDYLEIKEKNDKLIIDVNEKDKRISELIEENAKVSRTLSAAEREVAEKDALIEELDSAAVKISLELDSLAEHYSELVAKYENVLQISDDLSEIKRKADAYDKIVSRAKEKKNASSRPIDQTQPKNDKSDIDSILTGSAQEILEHIKQAQSKFSEAIANAQEESDLLKERVNNVINSSKEKILSQIK